MFCVFLFLKAIGCGEYHLLVVTRADADLYACGLNSYGQLGLGHTDNKTRLEVVEDLRVRDGESRVG